MDIYEQVRGSITCCQLGRLSGCMRLSACWRVLPDKGRGAPLICLQIWNSRSPCHQLNEQGKNVPGRNNTLRTLKGERGQW